MNPTPRIALCTGKFLALVKEGRWEYVDRIGATGAAIIVAVTDEQKLLLVEQYRIPVHARTIELPAGVIGDQSADRDESHADAAKRELLEETGYSAATHRNAHDRAGFERPDLGSGHAAPGIGSEACARRRRGRSRKHHRA